MKPAKTSNHEKAPQCAAFVKAMREAFGEVKVTYVSENGFELGAKDDSSWVVATPISGNEESRPKKANARTVLEEEA